MDVFYALHLGFTVLSLSVSYIVCGQPDAPYELDLRSWENRECAKVGANSLTYTTETVDALPPMTKKRDVGVGGFKHHVAEDKQRTELGWKFLHCYNGSTYLECILSRAP